MSEFRPKDLCVVIPTRERWDMLERTLRALRMQTVGGFEVIVLADGPEQPARDLDGARLIMKPNTGVSYRRNLGARSTERSLILLLGDDTIPAPDLIERHLFRHNRDREQEVAILGKIDWHPEVRSHRVLQWLDWSNLQFDYENIRTDEAGWGRFYTSNVSVKREFFLKVGGFDEDFTFAYEDIDLGMRLNDVGLKLLFEPAARVYHHHAYDMAGLRRRFVAVAEGEWLMIKKHPEFPAFFADKIKAAAAAPAASAVWPLIVDRVPTGNAVRRRAEDRANMWYLQQVADAFLSAWEGQADREELEEYLGADYDEGLLRGHEAAIESEFDGAPDEETFYRTSKMYLYDLTAFAMTGTKRPYLNALRKVVRPGARLLDWGCGIGADGLRLIDEGYEVSFADFDNPSTAYLRWRLQRRHSDAPVYEVKNDDIPGSFDAAYSFDVIEHVDDPFAFLDAMEKRASIVMVNLLEPDPNDIHLHKPLPVKDLLRRAEDRGIVFYRKFHGRSHLVAYRTGRGTLAERALGRARRLIGSSQLTKP